MTKRKSSPFEIHVVTIFPEFFKGPLSESLIKKAREKELISIEIHNLRDYTHDRHKSVDDRPFGGGPGMVLKPGPIFDCVEAIQKKAKAWVVILDPKGERLTQKTAAKLAEKKRVVLIAGHYEGVDHRVQEALADQSISVGDFITMGGEAPALCVIESVTRLLPGVIGNQDSLKEESFEADELEYPQYTRPQEYRGMKVPEVLISGNHKEVEKWRREVARRLTHERRPDLNVRRRKI